MNREKKTEMVVVQVFGEVGSPTKFSVEPVNEKEQIDREYLKDLVEEAIMDAYGSGKEDFDEVCDSVAFALQNEGFIVRDFPNEIEQLSFDVTKYQKGDQFLQEELER